MFIWLSWYGLAPSNVVLTVSSVLVAARVSALAADCLASCGSSVCQAGMQLHPFGVCTGCLKSFDCCQQF
jgi:hypothetical protein